MSWVWRVIALISFVAAGATVLAYAENPNLSSWFMVNTSSAAQPFWTSSQNPQDCGYMNSSGIGGNANCTLTWIINASGANNLTRQIKVIFNSTTDLIINETQVFNVTIYDKGASDGRMTVSNSTYTESCTGCAFTVNSSNPRNYSSVQQNQNLSYQWFVNATGPYGSVWDVFAKFNWDNGPNQTSAVKARIVKYLWWQNGTYDPGKGWNCRQLINITQSGSNTGYGLVEIHNFTFASYTGDRKTVPLESCEVLNCTKEVRVMELQVNGTQTATNQTIQSEYYSSQNAFCTNATLVFETNLTANQTKTFIVYYNNPLVEKNYPDANLGLNVVADVNYSSLKATSETVWEQFFQSAVDFWWYANNATNCDSDCQISQYDRNDSNTTYYSFINTKLNYYAHTHENKPKQHWYDTIGNDLVYYYVGHGGINGSLAYNQTHYIIDATVSPTSDGWFNSDELNSSATPSLSNMKLAFVISSYGGDNSTTLTGCPLQNWISNAFKQKGTKCFLSFLGKSEIKNCGGSCGGCPDTVGSPYVDNFNTCFWSNITTGKTIRDSATSAKECSKDSNPFANCDNTDCVHYVLVNSTVGGCDQFLNTTVV